MVVIFISVYLQQKLHFTLQKTGVIMAMVGAGSLLSVFVAGRLIDRIGYYPVMLWSLIAGGIMFIVLSKLNGYLSLCIGCFLLSLFSEAFRPANMAALSYYSLPENYTRTVSLNRLAINLGFSVGPAVGGFLAAYNYSLLFWVDGLTCLGAALIVFLFLENKRHDKMKKKESILSSKTSSPYRDKVYLWFLPLATLYTISFFQFFSTMPIYYKQVQHLTESQIGWIMALNGIIVAAIEMIMIYKIENKWSLYNFISLGAVLTVISYLALPFINGLTWIIILTVIISFSEMFALPFMNTFMNSRSDHSSKGQYASLYIMTWSVAQIGTPIIATQVIAGFGFNALWILLSFFALLVAIGIKFLERLKNKVDQF